MRAGADIGGTFTDVIVFDPERRALRVVKLLSSADLHSAIVEGLAQSELDPAGITTLVHGSTIVINTLIERTGARTALVTTEGFRDVYEIGRVNRPDSFNLFFKKHVPLVDRSRRFEVSERMLPGGELAPVDRASVERVIEALEAEGVEAVAILLLHAYAHPEHEREVRDLIADRLSSTFISASHEVSREYREFERTSTVVANAYVGPRVADYLTELEAGLERHGVSGELMLMQSDGGVYTSEEARRNCIAMIESGPAGGAIGTAALVGDLHLDSAVAFDMGGTTAKAAVIEHGQPRLAHEFFAGPYGTGLPIQVPVMDIHEVGTGGGSIAYVTEFGELRVGPKSAGANPGPAAYGRRGAEATVTDANVVLGRLSARLPLAGGLRLDAALAEQAVRRQVAEPLGLGVEEAASAVLEVANASMAHAIAAVTVERGLDPAAFALVAYGGAGPLHATQIARQLGIRTVVIPPNPGVFSAYGMLFADLRRHRARTFVVPLSDATLAVLRAAFGELAAELEGSVVGLAEDAGFFEYFADMRYRGQEHSVTLPVDLELLEADRVEQLMAEFHELHERIFSHHASGHDIEMVTLRVVHVTRTEKPAFLPIEGGGAPPSPLLEDRVVFAEDGEPAPFFARHALRAEDKLRGPAVVVEPTASTVLFPGDDLVVHRNGHLIVSVGEA